jgi:hypothetical protein
MNPSTKYLIMMISLIAIGVSVYALVAINNLSTQQEQINNQESINKTIDTNFGKNFKRQNFIGNTTINHIENMTEGEVKLLKERTPMFGAIIKDLRTLINNQYMFSLPDNLNVSGVSNETDNFNLTKIEILSNMTQ